MKIALIFSMAFLLYSCSIREEEEETSQPFAVESITVNDISRNGINFTAYNSCGSMCWKRTFVETKIDRTDIYVKTIAVFDKYAACPAVCVGTETPVSINLSGNGIYNFHFWQSDSTSLDSVITIN
ncbi:MAG: hypothetical protein IPM56_18685 [Ignavibacteriales bacterium]|nr:MAG: hypothetical protein IPM56_18685 [Ignavibacteriales bacterium]